MVRDLVENLSAMMSSMHPSSFSNRTEQTTKMMHWQTVLIHVSRDARDVQNIQITK